jgi:hypothetical protein
MINYQFSQKFKLLGNVKLNYLTIILTLILTCGLKLPFKLLRNGVFNHLTIILAFPSRVGPNSPLMNKTQHVRWSGVKNQIQEIQL